MRFRECEEVDFASIVPDILRTMTQLRCRPTTPRFSKEGCALGLLSRHGTTWRIGRKRRRVQLDQADQVNASNYNLILWKGLVGDDVAYPAERDGRDLSKNRGALLKQWRESRIREFTHSSGPRSRAAGTDVLSKDSP